MGSGFWEPGGTPPPRLPSSTPRGSGFDGLGGAPLTWLSMTAPPGPYCTDSRLEERNENIALIVTDPDKRNTVEKGFRCLGFKKQRLRLTGASSVTELLWHRLTTIARQTLILIINLTHTTVWIFYLNRLSSYITLLSASVPYSFSSISVHFDVLLKKKIIEKERIS